MKKLMTRLFVTVSLLLFAVAAQASDKMPSAKVTIDSESIAIGVGFQWGGGTISFEGKEYKFKVYGLSIIDVGATSISATGDVYNLKSIDDFPGTFMAAEAAGSLGEGKGISTMKNGKDVVMKLTSNTSGVKLKLAPEGIKIKMEK